MATGVSVLPDDLTCVVDAFRFSLGAAGVVERGVGTSAQEKAVVVAAGIVRTDDLARVVDAVRKGVCVGRRIIEGEIGDREDAGSRVVQEAVIAAGVAVVIPDDLPQVVDSSSKRLVSGEGIVEGDIGATAKEEPMSVTD